MYGKWFKAAAGGLAAVFFCLCTAALCAQESVQYASVGGRVTDPQGAVVPGARVTARQVDTNVARETRTDAQGRFRFPNLRVGAYEISIDEPGFMPLVQTLTLGAGTAFELPLSLALAGLDATVTVTGAATTLDAARTQIAATVAETEARQLPMNGRNFLDLALLVPGVAPTNVASTQLFAETSAVAGPGLSVGSQRNFSNSFIVDGLSANDDAAGLSGMPYSVDAVEQFQVVTSGGQAELGRALAGYVNIVTKSGTNTTTGDLYEYFRSDDFNAANPLSGTTLPMRQHQYGGSMGGPLVKNRTFYFGNVEQRRLDQSGLTTITPAAVAAINAKLAASGYPGSPVASGTYPNPVDTTNGLLKLDHQVADRDQLSVRYSQYNVTSLNSRGAGGLIAPSASTALDNVDRTIAFANTMMLSSRTVNETRAQLTYGDLQAPPADPVGPAVAIAGVASFGTASVSPTRRVNRLYQVVDTLSHQAGAHAIRTGVDLLYNDDTITYPRAVRGAYTFGSLASFLTGTYNNAGFTQTFGDTDVRQANPNVGLFAQDEWKVTPAITLNAGVRYDLQFLETIAADANNVAPRVGLAWAPTSSRRTVLRASAGLFYDRVPLRAVANALLSAGNTTDVARLRQIPISLSPAQAGAPVFPDVLAAPVPSVTLPNLTTMDPHMQNASSRQAGAELEQQLGDRTTLSVGYQYTAGNDLIVSINQNVPACVAQGTNNGCRPNPAYGNNSQYSPLAASRYHGVHVSLVQRPAKWSSYRFSYTLSKAMSDVGEFFFSSPIDPFDLSKDWGRSDDDQRHRLVMSGAITAPNEPPQTAWQHLAYGFQLSGSAQYYSALPLNITSGLTTIQGTVGRPVVDGAYIDRNSGTGPDFFSLSARISRAFKVGDRMRIEAIVEGFNLTNHVNVVTMNGNFGAGAYPANPAPTFGQVTAVSDPRTFQLAVRARF
jgi:outer membrane receptor protein involved in Fe transport